jgi:KaiC/GvpD/RAD55 family RecA-like ATPase
MGMLKTGVVGLDKILGGGITEGLCVLVTGGPGTGKTILAMQFLFQGAKLKQPGLYITTEESVKTIETFASSLGFDFEKYKDLITIVTQPALESQIISLRTTLDIIKSKKIKRVVLDSISLFEYVYPKNELEFRKGILDFIMNMKNSGVTLVATAERSTLDLDMMEYKPHDFLFEGLIIVTRIRKGYSFERCIHIAKMRTQEHSIDIFPMTIGKGGIKVLIDQPPFSIIDKDG